MTDNDRMRQFALDHPTSQETENLLLDELEDKRLRRLGIDPDGDSVDIMLELQRRMEALKTSQRK